MHDSFDEYRHAVDAGKGMLVPAKCSKEVAVYVDYERNVLLVSREVVDGVMRLHSSV